MSGVDWFLNAVYVVYVVAPISKNELWLRILLTVTAAGFVVWGSMIDNSSIIFWNSLFAAISIFAIVRLIHERRSIELNDELARVKAHLLPSVSNRDFLTFWGLGTTRETEAPLTAEGSEVDELMLILEGEASVRGKDREIAHLGAHGNQPRPGREDAPGQRVTVTPIGVRASPQTSRRPA